MRNGNTRVPRVIRTSLAVIGMLACVPVVASQEGKTERGGTIIGQLKSQKDTPDGKNTFIEVLAPGEEKARRYHVLYDEKAKGAIASVLSAVRAAKVGDMVEFDWVQTGHGPAMKTFRVLKRGADASKAGPHEAHRHDKLKQLLKERLAAAREMHQLAVYAYSRGDPKITYIQVHDAKATLLQAQLDLADTKEQRLRILEDMMTDASEWQNTVTRLVKAGMATQIDQLRASIYRLERQIALERAMTN